jgi:cytidine deaminase
MLRDPNGAAVAAARALISERAKEGRHHVAATVLTRSGQSYTAVNIDSVLGRAAVCAEAVAIGMATTAEPDAEIVFVCAVNRRLVVIAPCGLCRELLLDYGPDAHVAVPSEGMEFTTRPLSDLMPDAYKAGRRGV